MPDYLQEIRRLKQALEKEREKRQQERAARVAAERTAAAETAAKERAQRDRDRQVQVSELRERRAYALQLGTWRAPRRHDDPGTH
jgi:predicted metalloendopeptidase